MHGTGGAARRERAKRERGSERWVFSGETDILRHLLVPLGLLTAAAGALLAFVETDLKRVLALTTVSHVGVLLVALALQSPLGIEGGALSAIVSGAALIGVAWRTLHTGYAIPQASSTPGMFPLLAIAVLASLMIGANTLLAIADPQEIIHAGALRFIGAQAYAAAVIEGVRTPLAPLDPGSTETGPTSFIGPAAALMLVLLTIGAKRLRDTRLGGVLAFAASARRIHTGDARDYVTWAMLGIGAIGVTVAVA